MGSDSILLNTTLLPNSFNSRSRMGSDAVDYGADELTIVSIRAPAWGATLTISFNRNFGYVSIRAPAWGATLCFGYCPMVWKVSIRAPAWGATIAFRTHITRIRVSIRAPAWGATYRRY